MRGPANVFDIEPRAPLGALAGSYVLLASASPWHKTLGLSNVILQPGNARSRAPASLVQLLGRREHVLHSREVLGERLA
jgi:hypothetical protein